MCRRLRLSFSLRFVPVLIQAVVLRSRHGGHLACLRRELAKGSFVYLPRMPFALTSVPARTPIPH